MEVQRCVWRCLADFGPADRPEYAACVEARCNEATSHWSVAPMADGRGLAAGAADPVMGTQLWVICAAGGGPRYLALSGTEGPDAMLTLSIDQGQAIALPFRPSGGVYYAELTAPYAAIAAMRAGGQVHLFNAIGTALFSAPLSGAAEALAQACP